MSTDLTLISVDGFSVSVRPTANALRDDALDKLAAVARITNEEENIRAADALNAGESVSRAIEKARKEAKEPVLDLGRKIDSAAKSFLEELTPETMRVLKLRADWESDKLAKQREAERIRQSEITRIATEQRLEQERIAEEKARAEAEGDIVTASAKAAELTASIERQQQELAMIAPVVVPTKPPGQSARPVWKFEVTDIWLLARNNPGLVKIEPATREINEVIASQADVGVTPKIPGLRIWEDITITVRAPKGKTVDV